MLQIAQISLLVKDYDEAIAFYMQKLGFELLEDTLLNGTKRWMVVRPKDSDGAVLLLAKVAACNWDYRQSNGGGFSFSCFDYQLRG